MVKVYTNPLNILYAMKPTYKRQIEHAYLYTPRLLSRTLQY